MTGLRGGCRVPTLLTMMDFETKVVWTDRAIFALAWALYSLLPSMLVWMLAGGPTSIAGAGACIAAGGAVGFWISRLIHRHMERHPAR